jgi:L-ascorbate metabolism protein UlaG (beta-lactamase superfamily)
MDYPTLLKLKQKTGKVITGLGNGSNLEYWGFDPKKIIELDWFEQSVPDSGFVVTATPGRHFTGRTPKRNQTIWCSFVLQTPSKKIFIGGDSGYDTHFAKIGAEFGPFDLALLECGQYNKSWKYIHMLPEQTVQAAIDLKAKNLMPVHWGKFALSLHAWDEPIQRVTKEANRLAVPLVHPMIGELFDLDQFAPTAEWWKGIN